ncbi:MAG TPA: carbohydrate kinase family protein [Anaerolineae bacterium]|nr:carbohydrate kinase family protein [Anaerolineae bacterium]
MNIVLTGSIAIDYLMTFPGHFCDHILPDKLDCLSLSFLVDKLTRRRGGVAANIAYTMALLGERPAIMATVGEDFGEYRAWLESLGVNTKAVRTVPDLLTASFFVNTDRSNAQIASFYAGAMAEAAQLHFADLPDAPDLAVISPNDPAAMVAYVEECCRLGIRFVYDPSQQIVRLNAEALQQGIEGCEALFANDYEIGMIEKKTGLDRKAIAEKIKLLVITCGEHGSDIYSEGEQVHVDAVAPKQIADPTGVGDAYRGGFFKGYMHGVSLEQCGQIGSLAATYCLETLGPQDHSYDLKEFTTRFREHFDDDGELDRIL